MTWQSVGVLSPGEMGAAVATVLRAHGLRVVTCLEGRSPRTWQRAEIACVVVGTARGVVEETLRAADRMVEESDGARIVDTVTVWR